MPPQRTTFPAEHPGDSASRKPATAGGAVPVVAACVFIAAMYWWERSRGPGWGDSIGFLVSALEGFSWSPAAAEHLLYTNLNAAVVRIFPHSDPVTLLTLVSIVFAMATLVQAYRTGRELSGDRLAALLATIGLAFSFTFWRQAEQVEVYTTATFFAASALHAILTDTSNGTYRHVFAAGIWMGLGFLVHIQTILLTPVFVVYLYRARRTGPLRPGLSLAITATGILFLVIGAAVSPSDTVGSVFFSTRFRDQVLHIGIASLLKGTVTSVAYACYAFHLHLIAIMAGFVILARTAKTLFVHCLLAILPAWLFAMRYDVTDQYVFFLPAYLVMAMAGACGYAVPCRRLTGRYARALVLAAMLISPYLIYEAATLTAAQVPGLASFQARKAYKGGLAYFLRPGLRTSPDLFGTVDRRDRMNNPPEIEDSELWGRLRNGVDRYRELRASGMPERQ